jgi:hypothetical protein
MLTLTFDKARIQNDEDGCHLCLRVENPPKARQFVFNMKAGKYTANLKKYVSKRSLDQNAYFWKLCGELSVAVSTPPEEIYRELIKDIGGNHEIIPVKAEAVETWVRNWQSHGIGWVCDVVGESKLEGYVNVRCYYGSSVYDTRQMKRLLDLVIAECKEIGINTMTPEELARLAV